MPLRNRVDPWGDLFAVSNRGMFTGNRGCLVNDDGEIVRHHQGQAWIICRLAFRDWKHPLNRPRTWTPLFFLDEAVALAAGHRPCALCRRKDYTSFCDAIAAEERSTRRSTAQELNRRLAVERLKRGSGLSRAKDRKLWTAEITRLPAGTIILDGDHDAMPRLLTYDEMMTFTFDGWADPIGRPGSGLVQVLTPPTSVAAIRGGYRPKLTMES